jgi:ACDE family multidrug resistance protein
VPVLASSISAYLTGAYLQERVDRRYLVSGGLALIALALASLTVLRNPYYVYVAVFLVGAGAGAVLATLNVLVTGSVRQSRRGMITSDYGAVRFFGVALGPPLFGLVMERGSVVLFGAASSVGVLAAVLTLVFLDPRRLLGEATGGGPS